jgi:hypothetical protein
MSYLWLSRGLPVVTQRHLDGTLLATTAFERLSLADARTHILCDACRCEDSNYHQMLGL